MFIINWKKDVFTIPNILSAFRLILIPVYVMIYLNAVQPRDYLLAGSILAVSCMTDAVDGMVARKCNMTSNLGKILDPMADKLTQLTLTICLSLKYPVLNPVVVLLLIKEICQLIGAVILMRRGGPIPSSMMAGKICTTVLFVSLITLVLFPDIPGGMIDAISLIDSLFLIYAFVTYYHAFFGRPGRPHGSQI